MEGRSVNVEWNVRVGYAAGRLRSCVAYRNRAGLRQRLRGGVGWQALPRLEVEGHAQRLCVVATLGRHEPLHLNRLEYAAAFVHNSIAYAIAVERSVYSVSGSAVRLKRNAGLRERDRDAPEFQCGGV